MRCLVLFSGGLESLLAARVMQLQGVEAVGVFVQTICARHRPPQELADQLGMELIVAEQDEGFCQAIRHPTLGRTKNSAACLDCRVQLLRRAKDLMQPQQATFTVTGEVLGQRPRSQNRRDLEAVAYHSGVEDLLVRPLSAKLLPETRPEREGWIDREQLCAFHGNSHQGMIELARRLNLSNLPASRPGCGLTDAAVSARVFDHLQYSAANDPAEFNLLSVGRHFRLDATTKVIVGRNQLENDQLSSYFDSNSKASRLLRPHNFVGPTALAIGDDRPETRNFAGGLVLRFGKPSNEPTVVKFQKEGQTADLLVEQNDQAASAVAIGTA